MRKAKKMLALMLSLMLLVSYAVPAKAAMRGDGSYEGQGYEIIYRITSSWDNGYITEVSIKNTGEQDIENWKLKFSLKDQITSIWNATFTNNDQNEYQVKNAGWNQRIKSGQSVTFGFQATGNGKAVPQSYVLLGVQKEIAKTDYKINYEITEDWVSGKTVKATIQNLSKKDIEDWRVTFQSTAVITNMWDASMETNQYPVYVARYCDYNSVIKVGKSVSFFYQIQTSKEDAYTFPNDTILTSVQEEDGEGASTTEKVTESTTVEEITTEIASTEGSTTTELTECPTTTEVQTTTETTTEIATTEDTTTEEFNYDLDWNRNLINANDPVFMSARKKVETRIKIAYLDSGIDYSEYVNVVERKNFLDEYDDSNIIFDDVSGHGTAGAALLAGRTQAEVDAENVDVSSPSTEESADIEDMTEDEMKLNPSAKEVLTVDTDTGEEEVNTQSVVNQSKTRIDTNIVSANSVDEEESEKDVKISQTASSDAAEDSGAVEGVVTGVNPNVDIYSARVLNQNKEGKIDKIVEAIDWAIDKKVNIINIAWGTKKDDRRLKEAIQKAADNGILVIAAADNEKTVEYPAKYETVLSVGSVDSEGKKAKATATGQEVEVTAPGQDITSYCLFNYLSGYSGTSMAVAQVTGLASVLWQQDGSVSADFIRQLIDSTARKTDTNSQFGLIDCAAAITNYEVALKEYSETSGLKKAVRAIRANEDFEVDNKITGMEDSDEVHGFWMEGVHKEFVEKADKLKNGIIWNDKVGSEIDGASDYPGFHGYFTTDYVSSYLYLMEQAENYSKNGKVLNQTQYDDKIGNMEQEFKTTITIAWKQNEELKNKEDKAAFIYGMALHTITDTFAHCTYEGKWKSKKYVWTRIKHVKMLNGIVVADNKDYKSKRFECAKEVARKIVNRYLNKGIKHGKVIDFCGMSTTDFLIPDKYDKNSDTRKEYIENAFSIVYFNKYVTDKMSNPGDYEKLDNKYVKKYVKNWHILKLTKKIKEEISKNSDTVKIYLYDKYNKKRILIAKCSSTQQLEELKLILNKKHAYILMVNLIHSKKQSKTSQLSSDSELINCVGYMKKLDFSAIKDSDYEETEEYSVVCLESEIELTDADFFSVPIAGTVVNDDDENVENVKVTLKTPKNEEYVTYTDQNGYYSTVNVGPGIYYLTYEKDSFDLAIYKLTIYDIDDVEIEIIEE